MAREGVERRGPDRRILLAGPAADADASDEYDGEGIVILGTTFVTDFRKRKCSSIGWPSKPTLRVIFSACAFVWIPWN